MRLRIMFYIVISVMSSFAISTPESKIMTDEGYPYKQLIAKSSLVKIKYRESHDRINCHLVITTKAHTFISEQETVTKKRFKKYPMASCMKRSDAKQLLNSLL